MSPPFDISHLSAEEQAIVTMATVLGIANGGFAGKAEDVRRALGIPADRFEALVQLLYEEALVWRTGDRLDNLDALDTAWLSDLASMSLGPAARPRKSDWEALRQLVFGRVFADCDPYCLYCKTSVGPFVLDHGQPVSRGGSNHPDNLLPACVPCNSAKGSKTFAEFMTWRTERGL